MKKQYLRKVVALVLSGFLFMGLMPVSVYAEGEVTTVSETTETVGSSASSDNSTPEETVTADTNQTAVDAVNALIAALPSTDEITAENVEAVNEQLSAISDSIDALDNDEGVDYTTLEAVANAVNTINSMAVSSTCVATIGSTKYTSLQDAVNAVSTDGTETTIVLQQNVNYTDVSNSIAVLGGRNIVFDFNGYTITYTPSSGAACFKVTDSTVIFVNNNSVATSGGITTNGTQCALNSNGTLIVKGGKFVSLSHSPFGNAGSKASLTIQPDNDKDVAISGKLHAVASLSGNVDIYGGTFKSTDRFIIASNAEVNIYGGVFEGQTDTTLLASFSSGKSTLNITGGTFKTNSDSLFSGTDNQSINISGGTWLKTDGTVNNTVVNYLTSDYIQDSTTGEVVFDYKASVTTSSGETTGYESVESAIAALKDGDTLKLLSDYTGTSIVIGVPNVTLDLNGYDITPSDTGIGVRFYASSTTVTSSAFKIINSKSDTTTSTITSKSSFTVFMNFGGTSCDSTLEVGNGVSLVNKDDTSSKTIQLQNNAQSVVYSENVIDSVNGIPYKVTVKGTDRIYGTLENAAKAGGTGTTVTLLKDYEGDTNICPSGYSFILDLSGKTYTYTGSFSIVSMSTDNVAFEIKNGSLEATKACSTGLIAVTNSTTNTTLENASLTLNAVTVSSNVNQTYGIVTNGLDTGTKITLTDSTLKSPGAVGIYAPAINGELTITDSTVKAATGINVRRGTVTISETSAGKTVVTATGDKNYPSEYASGGANSTGDAIYVEGGYDGDVTVSISGGKFTSSNASAVNMLFADESSGIKKYEISGGKYSSVVPAEYCADGYEPVLTVDTDGMYTVEKEKVASVTDYLGNVTYYTDLQSAFDACTGETDINLSTVTLLKDIVANEEITVGSGKVGVLEFGGHTLTGKLKIATKILTIQNTVNGEQNYTTGGITSSDSYCIKIGGKVNEIKGGRFICHNDSNTAATAIRVGYDSGNASFLYKISGGWFTGDRAAILYGGGAGGTNSVNQSGCSTEITGGVFDRAVTDSTVATQAVIGFDSNVNTDANGVKVKISGGYFIDDDFTYTLNGLELSVDASLNTGKKCSLPSTLGITTENTYITILEYVVKITSRDTFGNSIEATTSGGGIYLPGTNVTISAKDMEDYDFVGWFEADASENKGYSGDCISSQLSYTFSPSEDYDLIAVYSAKEGKKATITVVGGTIIDGVSSTSISGIYDLGTSLTVTPDDSENFDHWENSEGMIVARKSDSNTSGTYIFTVAKDETLTAVSNTSEKMTIICESYYGQVIKTYVVDLTEFSSLDYPEVPTRFGYTGGEWTNKPTEFATNTVVTVKADNYTATSVATDYTVTANQGTVSKFGATMGDETSLSCALNDHVTVQAEVASEGMKFYCWKDVDGNILSYTSTYSFYVTKSVQLTANYVEETTIPDETATALIIDSAYDSTNQITRFVALLSVPDDCTITYAGIVATNDSSVKDNLTKDNAKLIRGTTDSTNPHVRYTLNIVNKNAKTMYARAYLVYQNSNGDTIEIYGDVETVNVES